MSDKEKYGKWEEGEPSAEWVSLRTGWAIKLNNIQVEMYEADRFMDGPELLLPREHLERAHVVVREIYAELFAANPARGKFTEFREGSGRRVTRKIRSRKK